MTVSQLRARMQRLIKDFEVQKSADEAHRATQQENRLLRQELQTLRVRDEEVQVDLLRLSVELREAKQNVARSQLSINSGAKERGSPSSRGRGGSRSSILQGSSGEATTRVGSPHRLIGVLQGRVNALLQRNQSLQEDLLAEQQKDAKVRFGKNNDQRRNDALAGSLLDSADALQLRKLGDVRDRVERLVDECRRERAAQEDW